MVADLEEKVQYTIVRSSRKTLSIRVEHSGEVIVHAPGWCSHQTIEQAVLRKREWIERTIQRFSEYEPRIDHTYEIGEPFYYEGARLLLAVDETQQAPVTVKGGTLVVRSSSSEGRKRQIRAWYRDQTRQRVERELKRILTRQPSSISWVDASQDFKVTVRYMRRRWGSCSSDGSLRFSSSLMCLPYWAFIYVVYHELCHLKLFDHSPAFYQLLSTILPDHRERQGRLTSQAGSWTL